MRSGAGDRVRGAQGATVAVVADGRMADLARRAARVRRDRDARWVTEGWVTRREAQRLLGLGRAQVDNLRRSGALASERNPATGAVRVSRESVQAELARRAGA